MQLAELFDQHFAGDQFQLEIERALHENLDRFLRGHYILLPWEWFFASSAVSFAYLIGGFVGKLDWGNEMAGECLPKKKAALTLAAFLLVDTIKKMQHTMRTIQQCPGEELQGWQGRKAVVANKFIILVAKAAVLSAYGAVRNRPELDKLFRNGS